MDGAIQPLPGGGLPSTQPLRTLWAPGAPSRPMILVSVALTALLLGTALLGLLQVQRVREQQALVKQTTAVRQQAERLRERVSGAGRRLQAALVRGQTIEQEMALLRIDTDSALVGLRGTAASIPGQQAQLTALLPLIDNRFELLVQTMSSSMAAGTTVLARRDMNLKPMIDAGIAVEQRLTEFVATADRVLTERERVLTDAGEQQGQLQALAGVLAFGLLLAFGGLAVQEVRRREAATADALRAHAAVKAANAGLLDAVDERTQALTQRNQELSAAHARLFDVSRRLLSVAEDERRALARELHDDLAQQLAVLKLNLQLMRKAGVGAGLGHTAPQALDDCVRLAESSISRVREWAFALRPSELDELGLEAALRAHAEREMQRSGANVRLHVDPTLARANDEWACAVYRIVQEALRNALAHGRAYQVDIELRCLPMAGECVLSVRDNGVGLPATVPEGGGAPPLAAGLGLGLGLGLISMRERAELLGGRFEIGPVGGAAGDADTNADTEAVGAGARGTLVRCHWPQRAAVARAAVATSTRA